MKHKMILVSALAVALASGSIIPALAAGTEGGTATYGYLVGQQKNEDRHAQFEKAAGLTDNAEREAFFEERGIGGGAYSDSQHLDANVLLEAGIIDQTTADKIAAYANDKHELIHEGYDGGLSDMTPEERHTFYGSRKEDNAKGDSVEELLNAGVITQEQADSIIAYMG